MGAIRNVPTCTPTPNIWGFIKISWSKAANGLDRIVNGRGAEGWLFDLISHKQGSTA